MNMFPSDNHELYNAVLTLAVWFAIGYLLGWAVRIAYVYFYYTRNFVKGRTLSFKQRWWLTRAYFRAEQEYNDD